MKLNLKPVARRTAPLAALLLGGAASCFAVGGTSPFGQWLQGAATEATSIWAISGSIVGLVVGLLGALFGEHHMKSWCAKIVVICVCLLAVQGLIAWL